MCFLIVVDFYLVLSWQIVTEVLLDETSGTNGHANFDSGITQAFEALNGSSECHKIVVMITDKDADSEQLSQAIEHQKLLSDIQVLRVAVVHIIDYVYLR